MPYTVSNPPERIKKLPSHAIAIWVSAYNSAYLQYEKNEEKANKVAWSAVKNKYKQEGDQWVKKEATEIKILNPIKASDFSIVEDNSEIQVLNIGIWKHPSYGKIEISEKTVNEFVKNFDNGVRNDIPITEGHSVGNEEKPAAGWFRKLVNKGRDGLWAVIEWTELGKELLTKKAYKYFSPEFYSVYEDPETHNIYKNVLVGGALTNKPYFKGLMEVALSEYASNKMELDEITKKTPDELTDEEKKLLLDKKEDLTDEEKEKFESILNVKTDEEKKKEEEEKKEKEKKEEEEKKGSEKMIQLSEATVKALERNAHEGVTAMAILRKQNADSFVKEFTFSEKNKSGLILPKSQEKMVAFYLSLTEKQQAKFAEILNEVPKGKIFGEIGEIGGGEERAYEKANKFAEEKMKKDDKLSYRQALDQVFSENPELAKRVEEEN